VNAAVAKGLSEHGLKSNDIQGFTNASKQCGLISCRIIACKWRSAFLSNVSHSGESSPVAPCAHAPCDHSVVFTVLRLVVQLPASPAPGSASALGIETALGAEVAPGAEASLAADT
jgi:hypothetical protein